MFIDYNTLTDEVAKKRTLIDSGRHRDTYKGRTGRWVIKVPHWSSGEIANQEEYELYKGTIQSHTGTPREGMAKCRLFTYKGIKCLIMECVNEHLDRALEFPSWYNTVDSGQVGVNRHGKVVAFDYSNI